MNPALLHAPIASCREPSTKAPLPCAPVHWNNPLQDSFLRAVAPYLPASRGDRWLVARGRREPVGGVADLCPELSRWAYLGHAGGTRGLTLCLAVAAAPQVRCGGCSGAGRVVGGPTAGERSKLSSNPRTRTSYEPAHRVELIREDGTLLRLIQQVGPQAHARLGYLPVSLGSRCSLGHTFRWLAGSSAVMPC